MSYKKVILPKVLVDIRSLETASKKRGLGRYTKNLTDIFSKTESPYHLNFGITLNSKLPQTLNYKSNVNFLRIPTLFWPKRLVRKLDPIFAKFWLSSINQLKPDLLYFPSFFENYYLSLPINYKSIITFHDLIPLIFNHVFTSPVQQNWYISRINEAKKATKFIAVSKSTKNDLVRLLKIDPEKIKVIYEGVDSSFRPMKKSLATARILRRYKITTPYILSVGEHSYYKNIPNVFETFRNYINKYKIEDLKLVIVCKLIDSEAIDWQNQVKKLGIEKKVIFTNYVAEIDLPTIYSQAQILFFPSLYEGFGLPVIEAMASGIPVLTSNISSMPEVGGKAAVYINPTDIQQMTVELTDILSDQNKRKYLIRAGLKRAMKFDWGETAQLTKNFLKELLDS